MAQQNKPTVNMQVVSSILKVDGKGWNIDLFDNKNKNEYLCSNCGHICCDAAELGCNHNFNDIYSYCLVCLQQIIAINNCKCPINSHSKPIIVQTRAVQRQILRFMVLCPYSKTFKLKNKSNDNNAQVEGIIIDNNIYTNCDINGCNFYGSLNDLITKHLYNCCKKYNPSYLYNIIIKKLKTQSKKQLSTIHQLKKENKKQKQEIQRQILIINDVQNQIQSLSLINKEKDQQIQHLLSEIDMNKQMNTNHTFNTLAINKKYVKWVKYFSPMTSSEFNILNKMFRQCNECEVNLHSNELFENQCSAFKQLLQLKENNNTIKKKKKLLLDNIRDNTIVHLSFCSSRDHYWHTICIANQLDHLDDYGQCPICKCDLDDDEYVGCGVFGNI